MADDENALEVRTLLQLPPECVAHALSFLPVGALLAFARASKAALAVASADDLWKQLFARRAWSHDAHRRMAEACTSRRSDEVLMEVRRAFKHLRDWPVRWRDAYVRAVRSETAIVVEIESRRVRIGFAGDSEPSALSDRSPARLRADGRLQDVEASADTIVNMLDTIGVPADQADMCVVVSRRDSVADVSGLALVLFKHAVARVRFVDADVAAMHAAGVGTGISLFIGDEYASAAALRGGRHVVARGGGRAAQPHFGRACTTSGALPSASSGGTPSAGGLSAVGGQVVVSVGTTTALDELCSSVAALGLASGQHDSAEAVADELGGRLHELGYVRAIAPARRPVQPDELEIGRIDIQLRGYGKLAIAAERFACFEHWFGAGPDGALASGAAARGTAGEQGPRGAGAGLHDSASVLQLVSRVIQLVDEEDRAPVYRAIVLHGRGARIRGIDARLTSELRTAQLLSNVPSVRPTIALGRERAHLAVWAGASALVHEDVRRAHALVSPDLSPWLSGHQLLRSAATVSTAVSTAVHAAIVRGQNPIGLRSHEQR